MQNTSSARKQLRTSLRNARKSLSSEAQNSASEGILEQVLIHNVLNTATQCGMYLSHDGEIDPCLLLRHCWQHKIHTVLPVLHPFTAGNLLFLRYSEMTVMTSNKYGIPEPVCEVQNVVPLTALDLLFVPLVGFDEMGNRLGMGGGYYDRTLNRLAKNHNTQIIGLAHDCQQVEQLPIAAWDVPLNAIVTPTRIIYPIST